MVRSYFKRLIQHKMKVAQTELSHQNKLLETSINIQERERQRIAADLHDDLIGNLSAISIINQVDYNKNTMNQLIQDSIHTARRISHDLSPPMLEHTTLEDLIKEKTKALQKTKKINYYNDIRQSDELTNNTKIQVLRIIQELMNNIHKHANATQINIHLRITKQLLSFCINENGQGYDVDQQFTGLGMKNIEMRTHFLKGKFRIKSSKNKGSSAVFVFNSPNL